MTSNKVEKSYKESKVLETTVADQKVSARKRRRFCTLYHTKLKTIAHVSGKSTKLPQLHKNTLENANGE